MEEEKCTKEGCAGSINFKVHVILSRGEKLQAAFPCNKCNRLHWYDLRNVVSVKNQQDYNLFLVNGKITINEPQESP